MRMRFFDSWWEHLATVTRLAPAIVTLLALVILRPLGYYWE